MGRLVLSWTLLFLSAALPRFVGWGWLCWEPWAGQVAQSLRGSEKPMGLSMSLIAVSVRAGPNAFKAVADENGPVKQVLGRMQMLLYAGLVSLDCLAPLIAPHFARVCKYPFNCLLGSRCRLEKQCFPDVETRAR